MRLYAVSRADLSSGQQAVQACHAVADLCVRHRDGEVDEWADNHKTMVILGTKNEQELRALLESLSSSGLRCQPFYEPDLDNQLTAFAIHPGDWVEAKAKLARMPLLGK
jgi:peptidyl-tRNA hydrolase